MGESQLCETRPLFGTYNAVRAIRFDETRRSLAHITDAGYKKKSPVYGVCLRGYSLQVGQECRE